MYTVLAGYIDKDSVCFPSVPTLAEAIGKSIDATRRYLGELVASKWVGREEREGRSTVYTLYGDPDQSWKLRDEQQESEEQPPAEMQGVTPGKSTTPRKSASTPLANLQGTPSKSARHNESYSTRPIEPNPISEGEGTPEPAPPAQDEPGQDVQQGQVTNEEQPSERLKAPIKGKKGSAPPAKAKRKRSAKQLARDDMSNALLALVFDRLPAGWSTLDSKSQANVRKATTAWLKAGASAQQIRDFGVWWYTHDWRGTKGQAPELAQIKQEWGAYKAHRQVSPDFVTLTDIPLEWRRDLVMCVRASNGDGPLVDLLEWAPGASPEVWRTFERTFTKRDGNAHTLRDNARVTMAWAGHDVFEIEPAEWVERKEQACEYSNSTT
jgi:hypothetical protein